MKLYKVITDTETFYVYAEDAGEAESIVTREHFSEVLDDDLADLFTTEEVTTAGIITSDDTETFKAKYERVRNK